VLQQYAGVREAVVLVERKAESSSADDDAIHDIDRLAQMLQSLNVEVAEMFLKSVESPGRLTHP
jgi:hypothetical protein